MDSADSMSDSMRRMSLKSGQTRTKLIFGIDYGTTYTGVAFVHENAKDVKEIFTFTDWPGTSENREHFEKTPSTIAYASENPDQGGSDAWGYDVAPDSKAYSWTKLLLDKKALPSVGDDPNLVESINSRMFQLPSGKQAVDVVADYLSKVHAHILRTLTERLSGTAILDVTPIEYWLTVPAIWSDEAKFSTREAALRAGFGKRPIDEVNLIPEPEAAALLALRSSLDQTDDLVKVGTGVLICDCGGGTVDITSYKVSRTSPRLLLDETSAGRGGKCGGTYIDRNLHSLLEKKYDTAFTSLGVDHIGPGSTFMKDFEDKKQAFSVTTSTRPIKLRLRMPDLPASAPGYDRRYETITLQQAEMRECFNPVVDKILQLIDDQINAVRALDQGDIKTVVLVGGLACSSFVRQTVMSWCQNRGIRMVTPLTGAWSAVARGAALHGLGSVKIAKRRMRRHYGMSMSRPYRLGEKTTSEQWKNKWKCAFTGEDQIPGWMSWPVTKNQVFDDDTEIDFVWTQHFNEGQNKISNETLYSCAADTSTILEADAATEKVGTLTVDYSGVDMSQFHSVWCKIRRKRVYRLEVKVLIRLGDRHGTLSLKSMVSGIECGTAHIDFSDH